MFNNGVIPFVNSQQKEFQLVLHPIVVLVAAMYGCYLPYTVNTHKITFLIALSDVHHWSFSTPALPLYAHVLHVLSDK